MSSERLRLYEQPETRSDRVKFMLYELGVEFDKELVDLSLGQHKTQKFLSINPYGAIPVLFDPINSLYMSESGSICHYLAEKYGAEKLIELKPGTLSFAKQIEMSCFAISTLDPICLDILHHSRSFNPEHRSQYLLESAKNNFVYCAKFLENSIKENDFLFGNKMSFVDFIVGMTLLWVRSEIEKFPVLKAYMEKIMERDSMKRVRADVKQRREGFKK